MLYPTQPMRGAFRPERAAAVLVALGALGCAYQKAIEPAEPAGFIRRFAEHEKGVVTDLGPFQYSWIDLDYYESVDPDRSERVYSLFIAPVGANSIEIRENVDGVDDLVGDVQEYLRKRIVKEVKRFDDGSYVVDVRNRRSDAEYAFEIELTELGLGNPILYTAAWLTPLPGIATAYDASHSSVLAMEARLVVVETGRVVAELADRKIPKLRFLDLNKAVSFSEPIMDVSRDWAREIAACFAARPEEEVEGEFFFTLVPW